MKMLNHEVLDFKHVARESLKRDMTKRSVATSDLPNNFLGYETTEDGYLKSKSTFGGLSDWLELSRYVRKVGVKLHFKPDGYVYALVNGNYVNDNRVKQALYDLLQTKRISKARTLNMQGNFLGMQDVNKKLSNTILYNWNVDENLVKFFIKSRLNIIPTNFNIFIWNRTHNPKCYLCQHRTESTAHVLNGCSILRNFYSARHNRIVDYIFDFVKPLKKRFRSHKDQFIDNIIPSIDFINLVHRRHDITIVDNINKSCIFVEVNICYDIYLNQASEEKIRRYTPLCDLQMVTIQN